jgi:hypothetical protein
MHPLQDDQVAIVHKIMEEMTKYHQLLLDMIAPFVNIGKFDLWS